MNSVKQVFRVKRKDINYIRWTVESYDGMAVVRTVDPKEAFIEILTLQNHYSNYFNLYLNEVARKQ